ncbi:MAG: hypothetical protein AseanaTS_25230 [Candidatus Pelagadaptatus aseana]|uniref:hypothetical protein n=1 Tax=Candidatus Pelagadaptatus aseana TaxID=3120508 RepID=UPI0039B1BF57
MKLIKQLAALVLTVPAIALAEPKLSKDWAWDLSGSDYAYAATHNAEGRVLGQYCYFNEGACFYQVSLGVTCNKGAQYPSILNSSSGAAEVRLVCSHRQNGDNVFVVAPFEGVDKLVKEASDLGFAVAMEQGQFKVIRFSLSGSEHAITAMRDAAKALDNASQNQTGKMVLMSEEYL